MPKTLEELRALREERRGARANPFGLGGGARGQRKEPNNAFGAITEEDEEVASLQGLRDEGYHSPGTTLSAPTESHGSPEIDSMWRQPDYVVARNDEIEARQERERMKQSNREYKGYVEAKLGEIKENESLGIDPASDKKTNSDAGRKNVNFDEASLVNSSEEASAVRSEIRRDRLLEKLSSGLVKSAVDGALSELQKSQVRPSLQIS